MEDFSKAPMTIGEIRAGKTHEAKDWGPRDLLMRMLRDIDSGKISPVSITLVYQVVYPDGDDQCILLSSAQTRTEQIGMMTRGMLLSAGGESPSNR